MGMFSRLIGGCGLKLTGGRGLMYVFKLSSDILSL